MNFSRAGELHRRAGRQAAQQDRPVGCTLGRSGGLHIKLAYGKGRAGGLPFSAARPALFRNQPDRLFVQHARPAGPPISAIHGIRLNVTTAPEEQRLYFKTLAFFLSNE